MLLKWLRDAHAMESSAESILSKQVKRVKDYPRVHQRIADHLDETRSQQERLEGCISRLGGDTSPLKEMVGKFTGSMQAFGAAGADDEIVKSAIADYQFECMEIASYRSLIAAAEVYAEPEVARVCKEILAEEEAMAEWLQDNISEVTRSFLGKRGVTMTHTPSKPGPERRSPPPPA
jgi:ferritin-like metal-binding protein YciE